jgi:hypothetical protein
MIKIKVIFHYFNKSIPIYFLVIDQRKFFMSKKKLYIQEKQIKNSHILNLLIYPYIV